VSSAVKNFLLLFLLLAAVTTAEAGGKKPKPTPTPVGKDPDWQGSGTVASPGAWLTGTNWVGNAVPGTTDTANFANSTTGVGIDMNGGTNNGAKNQAVGAITVSAGASNLTIGNTSTATAGTLTLNGATVNSVANTILSNTAGVTLTLQNTVGSGTKNMTVKLGNTTNIINATAGSTIVISSVISQVSSGSSVSLTGAGTLILTGADTYTGATTISGGTLQLGDGGTTGSLPNTSSIIDNANLTINHSDTFTQATDLSNVVISGTGSFTQAGTGTTTLSLANTYTGNTNVNAGTLSILVDNAIPTSSNVTVSSGATLLFGVKDTLQTIGGLSGSGTVDVTAGSNNVLTVGSGNASATFSGTIQNSVNGTKIGLTKTGTGTQTLSGTNTYVGATTVNAGTLLVNGSLASGSAVTVNNSGSVLGGTGTINGAVTISNVASSPGAILEAGTGSTGQTLTLAGSLTLGTNSIIELALGPSLTHSTLARTGIGAWSFQSAQKFTFILNPGTTTGTYNNIITGLAADPGTEGSWTITNAGFIATFTYDGGVGPGNIDLNVTAVPEPATWFAGALAVAVVGYWQRRRVALFVRRKLLARSGFGLTVAPQTCSHPRQV